MLSSKEKQVISDVKKRRKPEHTDEERTRLMMIREVFHETMVDHNVCVVLPDGVEEAVVFGSYHTSIKSRLRRRNVMVVTMKDLTEDHLDSNNRVIDLSGIRITS